MPDPRPESRCRSAAVLLATRLLAAIVLAAGCGSRAERVVLVTIDTLRADHLGCYGAKRAATRNLDSLAAEGVRFAAALAPTPLTLPSHASLLTALDPPRHGIRNNLLFRLPEKVPTLAEDMQAAGFATAAFVGAAVLDRQYGLSRGFDVYDDRMSVRRAAVDTGFAERRADVVVEAALAWLESAPDRFLLWLHLYDPHADYDPPLAFALEFPGRPYAGEIAFADFQIGRLLEALEARWPDGRSLIVVTSDHGEGLGEHGEFTHAYTLYDSTQRVPLLLRGPGLPRGRVVDAPVRLVDVAPTIRGLTGLPQLADSDGRDLRPLLEGEEPEGRNAYLETLATHMDLGWSPLIGLRSRRYKYIRAPRPELYDLAEDPREQRNVVDERREIALELDRLLDAQLGDEPPPAARMRPGAAQRAQLESLGYLVSTRPFDPAEALRIQGTDPKDGLPMVRHFLEALALKQRGEARRALDLLDGLEDGGITLHALRAEIALAGADPSVAERYARVAVAAAPEWSELHGYLGRSLEMQERWEEARAAFETAAELDPASAEPLVGLGRVAEASGDAERALEWYARAARSRGQSAEAHWRWAALLIEAGDVAQAEALLRALPEASKRTREAALRLARAEAAAGQSRRARLRLEQALERLPKDAALRRAHSELGGLEE